MAFEYSRTAFINHCLSTSPEGRSATSMEGVGFFWTSLSTPHVPLFFGEVGIIVMLQGRKTGRLGNIHFVYDVNHYLVLSLPMVFECAHIADPEAPLYGIFIRFEREDIAFMLAQMSDMGVATVASNGLAVAPTAMNLGLYSVVQRMIEVMDDFVAGKIIGASLRNEALFEVLRSERGSDLMALTQQGNDHLQLNNLIKNIRYNLAIHYSVEEMAQQVGMSLSSFHRAFRSKTGQAPLQYIKRLRLLTAKNLITFEGVRIGQAARQVGYESASQFSREYKNYFGESAIESRNNLPAGN